MSGGNIWDETKACVPYVDCLTLMTHPDSKLQKGQKE